MTISRRAMVKLGLALPIIGISIIAYSASREEKVESSLDPCVIAHILLYTPEVTLGGQASLSALVINRSFDERECIVDLVVDNYVVDSKKVSIPPLDFAYVNMSFKPSREGMYVLDIAGFQSLLVARAPPPKPPVLELPEELKKKFQSLLPGAVSFEEVTTGDKVYYKGFDSKGELLGYLFQVTALGLTDKLLVTAAVSPDYKIVAIDVEPAPGADHLFNPDIATSKFEDQFKGLGMNDLALKPQGKIDAVTMATYSSKAVVEAVRSYLQAIMQS
ncbi:MAG: FMN-binding protein [Desulfurococcales archaeon]|nr:FMN-binding protein [Desulfurococcales archaeon]